MKEIIPIKKDIVFKTKISEICEISLEHNYKVETDLVTGKIFLNGSYKMTEASVIEEDFMYTIPFEISISKRINKDTVNVIIDEFNYDIEKDILKININLCLTCEETEEVSDYIDSFVNDEIIEIPEEVEKEPIVNIDEKEQINTNITSITNNINENNYYTYKIYIVKEGDTIENIARKYNIDLKYIKEYNDITNINIGDKLIIPQIND